MRLLIILFCLNIFNISAQKIEKITFKSANPFALSDIITDLENQDKQDVYGELVIPIDSLGQEKKFPLVLGGEHSITPGSIKPFTKKYKELTKEEATDNKKNHICKQLREILKEQIQAQVSRWVGSVNINSVNASLSEDGHTVSLKINFCIIPRTVAPFG